MHDIQVKSEDIVILRDKIYTVHEERKTEDRTEVASPDILRNPNSLNISIGIISQTIGCSEEETKYHSIT
ncbi:MAG: hypothetical protein K2I15_01345 [Bacteroides sp.]|nr:hypothetical protein [Bacteroides sp.]